MWEVEICLLLFAISQHDLEIKLYRNLRYISFVEKIVVLSLQINYFIYFYIITVLTF